MGRRTRLRKSRHTGATTAIRTMLPIHHKATDEYLHVGQIPYSRGLYDGRGGWRKSVRNIERPGLSVPDIQPANIHNQRGEKRGPISTMRRRSLTGSARLNRR